MLVVEKGIVKSGAVFALRTWGGGLEFRLVFETSDECWSGGRRLAGGRDGIASSEGGNDLGLGRATGW